MEEQQESIQYGSNPKQGDLPEQIEADEFVVRKEGVVLDDGDPAVSWQEWVQMKKRGARKTLYVSKKDKDAATSRVNSKGFAVPPPYSKEEWEPLRDTRYKKGSEGINHSDGARVYGSQPQGWKNDTVAHGRSKAKGGPEYASKRMHETKNGTKKVTIGGTQALDAIGGHLKKNVGKVNARCEKKVDDRIREGQRHH